MAKIDYGKVAFKMFRDRAISLTKDPKEILVLIKKAEAKFVGKDNIFSEVLEDIKAATRLLKRFLKKEYNEVNKSTIIYIVFAILYFVTPLDLIFDFIPITGYIDDYSVIVWVLTKIRSEIEHYKRWETRN